MIRIIGGTFRGRKLRTPKGLTTRPVLGRVREALFNVIGSLHGGRVLDLFAGTGAVGIEALSRGAESTVFVDSGPKQCGIIRENLGVLDLDCTVIKSDTFKAIKALSAPGGTFDLIFADPPYDKGLGVRTLVSVFESGLLAEGGSMALTVRKNESIPETIPGAVNIFDRNYGDTRLLFYTHDVNDSE